MRIYGLMTNRLVNPMGYCLAPLRLSYKVDDTAAKGQAAARVRIAGDMSMRDPLYDSGRREDIDSLGFTPELSLAPRTRYWWDVTVWADNGEVAVSQPAFFETGKMHEPWAGPWITAPVEGNLLLSHGFAVESPVASARIYAVGLGLYELYLDGQKVEDELLTPFCNAYDQWIQVQTYDVGDRLSVGQATLSAMLGDGWYKGRFGFRGETCLYGDTQCLRLELHILYQNGTRAVIVADERWQASASRVRFANIYDGEIYDATFDDPSRVQAHAYDGPDTALLTDRLSPPVRVTERLRPAALLTTPAGETVLDVGQEITGYLEFTTSAPAGATLKLSYFETLQQGNYYRDNLRTAKQEYVYIADGSKAVIRPHFTFFGFRYVKLEGFESPDIQDFTACAVHSDLAQTGSFLSDHEKVNRLALNVLWGQRGNFLDVPTDCPQRDERMGWTGDAQAFAGTACFQMESAAFFAKYLYDMRKEQEKRSGAIPHVVPAMRLPGESSCAWADAAAIIPWTVYLFYGDKALLAAQYPLMKDWVEWIYRTDEQNGGRRLWDVGFHFADWLALDTKDGTPMGGTDPHFIASAYYFYSTSLLLRAARALGYADDTARYEALQGEILEAMQREYFTPAGRLAQTSQTGYICALFMAFARPEQEAGLARLLEKEFSQSKGKLRTGFVGTAYLCRTLSAVGLNRLAYSLLLNEEYPGWIYEINLGATTIWERWNSLLPDGSMSDTGMNSLNHYAYGAVMEWVYRDVAGLNPLEEAPGFRKVLLRPRPDSRLRRASFRYESAIGLYRTEWEIKENAFDWTVQIPFGGQAKAVFPNAGAKELARAYPALEVHEEGGEVYAWLDAGTYHFIYTPVQPFHTFGVDTKLASLFENEGALALLRAHAPGVVREANRAPTALDRSLREALELPFAEVDERAKEALLRALAALR